MKKYATGLTAVVLALALSAYSTFMEKKASAANNANKFISYYWYRVDDTFGMPAGSLQFGGPQTITYAELYDGCWGYMTDCLRGFQTPITIFPSYQTSDIKTQKNLPW